MTSTPQQHVTRASTGTGRVVAGAGGCPPLQDTEPWPNSQPIQASRDRARRSPAARRGSAPPSSRAAPRRDRQVLIDLDADAAALAGKACPGTVEYEIADLRDIDAMKAALAALRTRTGPFTTLVNNAARDDRHDRQGARRNGRADGDQPSPHVLRHSGRRRST